MGRERSGLFRSQRGSISKATLLFVFALAAAGYFLVVLGPIYYEGYVVKQIVRAHMNQAIKEGDGSIRARMVAKIRALDRIERVDASGRQVLVPVVDIDERDVTWERDTRSQPPVLHVSFDYVREVELPFLDRTVPVSFSIDLTNDLTVPVWDQ